METVFYDKNGEPIAYTEDGIHIYLYSGKPIAYLSGNSLYNYEGSHLGWFVGGWIRDHNGDCVYFTDQTKGGPIKPICGIKPIKGIKEIKPIKGVKEIQPVRPVKSNSWAKIKGNSFFSK
jgi:hypothetical protein